MMHKMKKVTSKVLMKPKSETEFSDYRSRLEAVEASLRLLREQIPAVEQSWRSVSISQMRFCAQFVDCYPDEDEVRQFAREEEMHCGKLSKTITPSTDARH
eukprot:IDg20997t1